MGSQTGDHELLAETFAAALPATHDGRIPDGPTAAPWLLTIARHKLFDEHRRSRVQDAARRKLALERAEPGDEDLARIEALGADRKGALALADDLPPDLRDAVRASEKKRSRRRKWRGGGRRGAGADRRTAGAGRERPLAPADRRRAQGGAAGDRGGAARRAVEAAERAPPPRRASRTASHRGATVCACGRMTRTPRSRTATRRPRSVPVAPTASSTAARHGWFPTAWPPCAWRTPAA